jgi:murein L,D-transpeptidase YcbB/YkuD
MKNQVFNEELISYLYGDMSAEKCEAFEQKMKESPELQKEYEALSEVRKELAGLEERDIVAPMFSESQEKTMINPVRNTWSHYIMKPIFEVAASLTLLLVAGYLTNFQLSIVDGKVSVGFNNKPVETVQQVLTEPEIRALMQEEMSKNNHELLTTAQKNSVEIDTRVMELEMSVKSIKANTAKSIVSMEELEQFFTMAETRNTDAMREFMASATVQQQQYLKALFTEYNEYLQQQRQDDLTLIRSGFIEMKQSQTQQKLQTDQVLASLISTVSTK